MHNFILMICSYEEGDELVFLYKKFYLWGVKTAPFPNFLKKIHGVRVFPDFSLHNNFTVAEVKTESPLKIRITF